MKEVIIFILTLLGSLITMIDTCYRLLRTCWLGNEPDVIIQNIGRRQSEDVLLPIVTTPPRVVLTRSLSVKVIQ